MIGNIPCQVTYSSINQLNCTPGPNPAGTYQFSVNVIYKGLAIMNVNTSLSFNLTASQIYPNYAGTGGGLPLNITGVRFNSNVTVTVDYIDCPVVFTNYSLITCVLPQNVSIYYF